MSANPARSAAPPPAAEASAESPEVPVASDRRVRDPALQRPRTVANPRRTRLR